MYTLNNGATYKVVDGAGNKDCSNIWIPSGVGQPEEVFPMKILVTGSTVHFQVDGQVLSIGDLVHLCNESGACSEHTESILNETKDLALGANIQVSGNQLVMSYKGCTEVNDII